MRIFEQVNPGLWRAVLLAAVLAAVVNLPPAHIAQRLDGALLTGFTHWLPQPESGIVVVKLSEFDALPALESGTHATIIGPTRIALGPIASPLWAAGSIWLLTLAAVLALLVLQCRTAHIWLLTLAGPVVLMLLSGGAFMLASIWLPASAPALFLLATGALVLQERRRVRALATAADGARPPVNSGLRNQWQVLHELPATPALLPEFYELAVALKAGNEPQLAADLFLRIALTDPDYRDVTRRLVSATPANALTEEHAREQLRQDMPASVGRYRLLEPIGKGATGRVYLAWDPRIGRLLAIKVVDLSLERDEAEMQDARARFLQEAELTGRLSHPNIVTVYDVDECDGRAYLAMEYLKGEVLSCFTSPDTLLPPALALELGAQAADALDFAHSRNVIHRDIKPANIMYDSVSGDLKITDFGIARSINVSRTRTGVVLGTPSFMSPEQIEGGNVKGHTDLFALGVSLYELLTGQLPFRGNSMTTLMFVIANEPHEPVSQANSQLPSWLDAVFDRALHKDQSCRFASGADMATALRTSARRLS